MKKLLFCCTAFLSLGTQPFFAQKAVVEKIIEIGNLNPAKRNAMVVKNEM